MDVRMFVLLCPEYDKTWRTQSMKIDYRKAMNIIKISLIENY